MTRNARYARPWAALVLVALIGAGCSNETAGDGSTGSTTRASGQDRAVRFAECVRGHGVPNFPDPDSEGEFDFGVDVTPAVFTKAVNACKALQPPGSLSSKRSPKQQTDSLRFARCVRSHGVRDFPDPVNGEPVIDTTKIPSTDAPGGMAILNAATERCRALSPVSSGGQG